ncbi:flagellar hook-length control protein FliK [Halomonas nitroreducens]|uniref:Flagellar hook-length control protein-like C-terminal domain-containing protein n=1 Tax=Halomonas nitroreducens TaxID=447425 RepID=A0A431V5T4_9GAMM|nr:flagellar hook-length control protein FliK [Halomonas nitroreducens]RTR04400.1 hypothetical protein EKG36_08745 [Halomonas nitroreducens]
MDIQQILAATQGQATTAKRAGDAASEGAPAGGFANALAVLSQGRPAAADQAAGQAAPDGIPRQAVLAALQALGQGATGEQANPLPEGLEGLGMLAATGPLPEALLAQLTRQPPTGSADALSSPTAEGNAITPELMAVMERLALIQGAGQAAQAPTRDAAVPGGPAALAALAAGTPTMTTRGAASPSAPTVAPPDAGTLNAMPDTRRGADGQPSSPPLTTSLENAGKANTAPPATPSPQALAEALSGGQDRGGQARPTGADPALGGMLPGTGATANGPAATTPTPLQATLSAPVNSPAWPQQLGQQLIRLGQGGGEQRIEMQLHPAELGPLSVTLKVGDQGAQAQFLSAHAQVRQALEQAIPQLREALAEQGIALGETSVGEQRQGASDEQTAGFAGNGEPGGGETEDAAVALGGAPGDERRGVTLDGRVDLYA